MLPNNDDVDVAVNDDVGEDVVADVVVGNLFIVLLTMMLMLIKLMLVLMMMYVRGFSNTLVYITRIGIPMHT